MEKCCESLSSTFGNLLVISIASINVFGQAAQSADPAPVPKAIAIPRPTTKEIRVAELSLAKFLETADPAVQAINGKWHKLIAVRFPASYQIFRKNAKTIWSRPNRETARFSLWGIRSLISGAAPSGSVQASRRLTNIPATRKSRISVSRGSRRKASCSGCSTARVRASIPKR